MLTVHCIFVTLDAHICWARSIQLKYPVISVQKPNGSVRSNRKGFEKTGPPFKVDHFCRLGWSDRKMTVPFDDSDPFSSPVPHGSVLPGCLPFGGFSPATGAVL